MHRSGHPGYDDDSQYPSDDEEAYGPAVCVFASIEGVATCGLHKQALYHDGKREVWRCPASNALFAFGADFGQRSSGRATRQPPSRFVAVDPVDEVGTDGLRAQTLLQAVLDAIKGTLDPHTEIADHPNVKFAQMERLKWAAERDRWQARAFDLGNGMMEAMAERDEARRMVTDDRYEHMVFDTLATDLWAEGIAVKAQLAAQAAQFETVRQLVANWREDARRSRPLEDAVITAEKRARVQRWLLLSGCATALEAVIGENTPNYAKASALTILPPPDGEP